MTDDTPWWVSAGDTLGLPGMAGAGASSAAILKKLLPFVRAHGLRAAGSLASAPLSTALTTAQVMQPTPANEGEKPFYVRDPATGQMVPNPANPFDKSMVPQGPQAPQASLGNGSFPSFYDPKPYSIPLPGQLGSGGFEGAPGAKGIGSDFASSGGQGIPTPAPAPTLPMSQPAPAPQAPQTSAPAAPVAPAYNPGFGADDRYFGSPSNMGAGQPAKQAAIEQFLKRLFQPQGSGSLASAQPTMAPQPQMAAPASFGGAPSQSGGLLDRLVGTLGSLGNRFASAPTISGGSF